MEETDTHRMFASAVTEEEWSRIPSEIAKKIQTFVVNKFDELFTAKALSETKKYDAETALNKLALVGNQVETLTQSLNERTEELLNMKKDNSLRCIQLENKLIEKTEELSVALETVGLFTNTNGNLIRKLDEMKEKLMAERDNDAKTYELVRQELEAKTKLADLYKNISDQNKDHSEELTKAVSELQTLLREVTNKYGDLETRYKEMQLFNEEIIAKKNEFIAMLKQELETSNEMFKAMQDESVQKQVEGISPAVDVASRLIIKPGMSVTQIYTQYVNVSDELTHEKEECNRLRSYIQDIFNEQEEKGAILIKQREDYKTALDTIKYITQKCDTLVAENQQLKEDALQYKRNEGMATGKNARHKKEVTDLSRQMHTTATGPSNIEPLSSSPTSSHTEYMPATSSATPTVVGPRQVAVPPTQSTQDTEDDDNNMQVQPAPQQLAVALVIPRVEQPSNGPAQESGTSSSSSNTDLKRPREVATGSCQLDEQGKPQQQTKRTRVQQGTSETLQSHGTVTDSGLEVEYQVPMSSHRDHDGLDKIKGDDDPDTEGYGIESHLEQELNSDYANCQVMEEEEGGNEVVQDSSEVPNQSEQKNRHNRKLSAEVPMTCETCGKKFSLKYSWWRHNRSCGKIPQYICAICEKPFKRRDALKQHIEGVHLQIELKCSNCTKKFKHKSNWSRHVQACVNKKKFVCAKCAHEFTRRENLMSHIRNCHGGSCSESSTS